AAVWGGAAAPRSFPGTQALTRAIVGRRHKGGDYEGAVASGRAALVAGQQVLTRRRRRRCESLGCTQRSNNARVLRRDRLNRKPSCASKRCASGLTPIRLPPPHRAAANSSLDRRRDIGIRGRERQIISGRIG